ncbi:MAG TPA: C2 family cysteine protease [Myxococcota bacterium]|nr:C2 family cysteine protease [Myxococcota bacterium]
MPQTVPVPTQAPGVRDSKKVQTTEESAESADALSASALADPLADPLVTAGESEGGGPDYGTNPTALEKHDGVAEWVDFTTSGTLFVDDPTPADVVQSHINDCFFVATIASVAQSNPDFIKGMVKEDSPGKYRVRYYAKDDKGKFQPTWIAVDASLPAKDGMPYYAYSENKKDGKIELWPSILEKAYAKLKGQYKDINWGNTVYSFEAVFGTAGDKVDTAKTEADVMWDQTKKALDANKPVVASTGKHVISVLSYTETESDKKVKVRDQAKNSGLPGTSSGSDTGGSTGPKDRTETMTWEAFRGKFTYVRFTSLPDAPSAPELESDGLGSTDLLKPITDSDTVVA